MGLDTKTCTGYDDMGQAEITQLKIKQDNIGQVRLGQDTVGTVKPQMAERYNKHDKPPPRDDQSTMYSATQSPSHQVSLCPASPKRKYDSTIGVPCPSEPIAGSYPSARTETRCSVHVSESRRFIDIHSTSE